MAESTYIFRPETGLWYPIQIVEVEGELTTQIDETGGILTPPPYFATPGTPLISIDHFLCFAGLSVLPTNEVTWTAYATAVSDAVENYCHKSWRYAPTTDVPLQIMMATALASRDLLGNKGSSIGMYKSYSGGDYSWTLQDGITPGDFLAPYKAMLNQYRELCIYA